MRSAMPEHDVRHRFRGWELRPSERLLLVGGRPVDIGARAFDVLCVLIERRSRVVDKGELLSAAWPGRVVEENNISVQIAALRKLLGPRAITTIPGIGYRLTAEPEPDPAPAAVAAAAEAPVARSTALFGRDEDLAALRPRVGHQPLVSLTGTGGVGKTTLAHRLVDEFAAAGGAVHWIDLAPLAPGEPPAGAVAAAVGVLGGGGDPSADLLAALARSRLLIALDNCEHVAAGTARLLQRALEAAPGVCWLVTSQVPLHLSEEHVHQLMPLPLPPADAGFDDAVRSGAVALLRARAAAAYRPFELTPANVSQAVALCRGLDGLPLAIEMAAGRIATLGLATVLEQLGQRLRLSNAAPGSPQRQLTLRGTLDWSHGLLSPVEQRVFRRLAPFAGSFSPRMAREIGCEGLARADGPDAWEVLEALSVLIERSLVHRVSDGSGRCMLLDSARDYARVQLDAAGETAAVHQRHAEVVAEFFAPARTDHHRLRDADWAAKYPPERNNVRAALAWAIDARAPDLLAQLVAALAQIDTFARNPAEVVHCGVPLDVLLQAQPVWRAAACVELSWAHFLDGNRKTGTELAQQAVADFSALGDVAGSYQALAQLVRLYESRPGLMAEARAAAAALAAIDETRVPLRCQLFRAIIAGLQYTGGRSTERLLELQALAQRAGFDTLAAVCRVHLTDQLLIERRFDEVVKTVRRFEAEGETRPRVRATQCVNLVLALVQLGRSAEAAAPAREVLRTLPSNAQFVVCAFALAAAREGRTDEAALMLGYIDRERRERDQRADPAEAAAEDELTARLVQTLPPARMAELRRLGAALPPEDAWTFIP